MHDEPAAPIGYRLGGVWETTAFIGRGPVGEVYECTGKDGNGPFAAKLLPEELLDSSDTWSEYLAAVSAVASLQHEATVRHVAFGSDLQLACPFVVTERVRLPSLAECIAKSGPFTPSRWRATLNVLASVVDRAHAAGVAHGRLTPTNVFVSTLEPEHVKISDFGMGIASAVRPGDGWSGGLRGWAGPECEKGATKPNPAGDVYSLGLLTFYALTGRSLFRALDGERIDEGKLRRELNEPIASAAAVARKLGVELDPAFDKWFSRTVVPTPVARYSSTRLLGEAFDRLVRRVEASRKSPVRPPAAEPRLTQRKLAEPKPAEPKPAEPKPAEVRPAQPSVSLKPSRETLPGIRPSIALARPSLKPALRNGDSRGVTLNSRQPTATAAVAVAPEAEDPPTLRMTVADLLAGIRPEPAGIPVTEVAPVADTNAALEQAPVPIAPAPVVATAAEPAVPSLALGPALAAEEVTMVSSEPTAPASTDPVVVPVEGLSGSVQTPWPVAVEPAGAVAGTAVEMVQRGRWRSSARAGAFAAALCLILFGVVIGKSLGASGPNPAGVPAAPGTALEATKCVAPEPVVTSAVQPHVAKLPSAPTSPAPVASAPITSAPTASAPTASAPTASAPTASAPIATPVASAPVASAAPTASAAPVASAARVVSAAPVARSAPTVRKGEARKAEPRRTRAPAAKKPCGTFINPCK